MFRIKDVKTQAVALSIAGMIALSSVVGTGTASANVPPPGGPMVGDYLSYVTPPSTPSPEKREVHPRSLCDDFPRLCDPIYEQVRRFPGPGQLSEAVTAPKVKSKSETKVEAKTKTKGKAKSRPKVNPKAISPVPVPTS